MSKQKLEKSKVSARLRGPYGLSIPAAGAMIGLSRSAAYQAAKRGEIPVLEIGALKIVPRVKWLRQIGVDPSGEIISLGAE